MREDSCEGTARDLSRALSHPVVLFSPLLYLSKKEVKGLELGKLCQGSIYVSIVFQDTSFLFCYDFNQSYGCRLIF